MWSFIAGKANVDKDEKTPIGVECPIEDFINTQNIIIAPMNQKIIDLEKAITELTIKINTIIKMQYENKVDILELKKLIQNQTINYY